VPGPWDRPVRASRGNTRAGAKDLGKSVHQAPQPRLCSKDGSASVPAANPSPGVEARLADLERKLDLLLERLKPPPLTPDTLPAPRMEAPKAVEVNPPAVSGLSPFEMDQPAQQTVLPPKGQQTFVQPPPVDGNAPRPFQQDPPRVAQQPVLPSPSAEIPPPPATRMPGESITPARSVGLPEPSVEVANIPPSARTRPDPFEAPAPQRSSLKEYGGPGTDRGSALGTSGRRPQAESTRSSTQEDPSGNQRRL
jgi:hypothetical protein